MEVYLYFPVTGEIMDFLYRRIFMLILNEIGACKNILRNKNPLDEGAVFPQHANT